MGPFYPTFSSSSWAHFANRWQHWVKWGKPGTLAYNPAHWSSGFGFSCQPGHRQDIWQNYARTLAAYRPRIIMSAPADQRGEREGCVSRDVYDEQMSWDQCLSLTKIGEGVYGWVAFWSLSTLILPHFYWGVIYTPAAMGQARKLTLSIPDWLSCIHTHTHTNNNTASEHSANFPHLPTPSLGNNIRVYVLQTTSLFFRV